MLERYTYYCIIEGSKGSKMMKKKLISPRMRQGVIGVLLAFVLFVTTATPVFAGAGSFSTKTKSVADYPATFKFTLTYYSYIEVNGVKTVSSFSNPKYGITLPAIYVPQGGWVVWPHRIDGGRTYEMANTCIFTYGKYRYTRGAFADFFYVTPLTI